MQHSWKVHARGHDGTTASPIKLVPRRSDMLEVLPTGDGDVLVRGELDAYTAPQLIAILGDLVRHGRPRTLVLDLADLEFIDLTGVGALVTIQNDARHEGTKLVLRSVPGQTSKILEITGLNQVFTIQD